MGIKSYIGNLMNFRGSGAFSNKLRVVAFLIPALMLIASALNGAYAEHDATVTISPDIANCDELGNTFTVNVENSIGSNDSIFEVRIYDESYAETYGIVEFHCGLAPYGWTLYDFTNDYGYCEYKTPQFGDFVIDPGENLDFTFDAVMEQEECYSIFLVSTLDNVLPTGQHQYHTPQVLIDCADPLLYKYLDGPWYGDCPDHDYIDHGDCWVQDFGTLIVPQVYDHPEDDECNLGLEYCTYRIWLDGSLIYEDTFDPEDPEYYIGWDFVFEEDTVHVLEIVCEDIAGNVVEHNETFFVDSQAPITWKEFGDPYKAWSPDFGMAPPEWHDCYQYVQHMCKEVTENPFDLMMCMDEVLYSQCGGFYTQWINSSTPVYLYPEDEPDAPCAVGVEETYWRNNLVPDFFCEYNCMPMDYYCSMCDYYEEHGGAPEYCYVPVYWLDLCMGFDWSWNIYEGEFYKPGESCHLIEYYSEDYLGNTEEIEWQCVFVDNTPPLSEKEHGTPIVHDEGFDWVTQDTTITLDCDDSRTGCADHPVYQETLCYKVSFDQDEYGEPLPPEEWRYLTEDYCDEFGGDYDEETGYCCVYVGDDIEETVYTFNFMEDSYHNLEYYCVDHLGNDERAWNLMYPPDHPITQDGAWIQWYKVDSVPPTIYKEMIGEDHIAKVGTCPPTSPDDECYVRDDGENGVYIEAIDGGEICAVDDLYCYYELWWDVPEDVMIVCDIWDDGWCLVQSGEFSYDTEVIFYEDSTHELYVFCNDSLGNWVDDLETFLVDSLPPETTKEYSWPYKVDPDCEIWCEDMCIEAPLEYYDECVYECTHSECVWWITSDTNVTLESWDAKVGVDEIYWRNLYFPENDEICHKMDLDGCKGECLAVMPMMTACHPMYYGEFVDGYNLSDWKTPLAATPWNVYDGAFTKSPESCHVIEYYAVDELGNEEPLHWQCVFVDNTGPEPVKEVGDPSIFVGEGGDCIYTNVTVEKLDVLFLFDLTGSMSDDLSEVQTDANQIMTEISALADDAAFGVGSFMDYDGMFSYCDYSGYYGDSGCGDYPWNLDQDITTDTGAVETAINGLSTACGDDGPESYARALYESQFAGWREGAERIIVIFEDNVPHDCNLGDYGCYYSTTGVDPGRDATVGTSDDLPWADVVADLVAEGISVIVLEADFGECDGVWEYLADETEGIYSQVGDGDIAEEIVALVSEVIIGDCDGFDWWVTTDTPIKISCDDSWGGEAPHPVDQSTMCYKVSFDLDPDGYITDLYCGDDLIDGWCCEYVGEDGYFEFYFEEDSLHDLEFFCMDHLENEGPIDLEYFKVDTTPPTTTKEFHGPFHLAPHPECLGMCEYECDYDPECVDMCVDEFCSFAEYIDTESWITLDSEDGGEICAVGVDKIWYMNEWYLEGPGTAGCWEPEIYCDPEYYGMLGNLPYDNPGTVYCINKGQELCAEEEEGEPMWYWWGYGSWAECVEDYAKEECGDDNLDEGWYIYDGDIYKDDESCHVLYYFAVDHLGNVEDVQMNCFFVDKTPPVIEKWYEGPYYPEGLGSHMGVQETPYPHYISNETIVAVNIYDPEPHPSGIDEVEYRVTLVDDAYCWDEELCMLDAEGDGDWETGSSYFEFNIDEESCHLIEVWAIDNVEKESYHRQCVFVDTTGPDPIKEVGELKYEWDGTDAVFYDIVEFCATPGNCWKVTMTTPITMECVDPDPHPVDHETLCFKVEFDADDATERYCEWYGDWMEEDGYCCIEGDIIEEFYFLEECEHNLDFYCIDILGNKGPHHDEKFKVEGTLFEIPLYKKWNLISVPFVLLDDNPDVVFKDLEGVDRVATYDGETGEWYVWSSGEGPDSLTSIEPGWGYWVLEMLDEEWLTIGGSLFSTSELPPSRPLVEGWNLIGYYGTSWTIYDMSDLNFMCGDSMVMPDMCIYGDNVYCSLNSLINTYVGYPKWSSLWSYLNCGGHESYWVGLNTCADPDSPLQMALSRMYAGRGYWIELDEADSYAPATTCIWNDDFECIWTGGGIIP